MAVKGACRRHLALHKASEHCVQAESGSPSRLLHHLGCYGSGDCCLPCRLHASYSMQAPVCSWRLRTHHPTLITQTSMAGVDWRQKLETQRGAVLATELKNNANKLAKWTAAALVAGADMIKLGYVSRSHPRDNHNHLILGTQVGCPAH